MAYAGMDPNILAAMRAQELMRRKDRWNRLQNELKLAEESLDAPEDIAAHAEAIRLLRENVLQLERETSPGYWKRLWHALLNK